ncbi:MAG: Rib/alpha-like domain-containing protein [Limosilactobacillus sp.]|uniref:Rib/alpha-like domain-containing protein n=1 Tax=Limosilactobacillus sp. TaxID=2773925 RepID=UPI0026FA3266|nr:Rib/alpha-like domain-containing protein [Limosilactobacillus sp.]
MPKNYTDKCERFALRKLTTGFTSVVIGATFLMVNSPLVHADTTSSADSAVVASSDNSSSASSSDSSNSSSDSSTATSDADKSTNSTATSSADTTTSSANSNSDTTSTSSDKSSSDNTSSTDANSSSTDANSSSTDANSTSTNTAASDTSTSSSSSDTSTDQTFTFNGWSGTVDINGNVTLNSYAGTDTDIVIPVASDLTGANSRITAASKVYISATTMKNLANRTGVKSITTSSTNGEKVTASDSDWRVVFADSAVSKLDLNSLDTSAITSLVGTFANTPNLTEIDVSDWDVSNVTDMGAIFMNSAVTSLKLNKWNTSKVTNLDQAFANFSTFNGMESSSITGTHMDTNTKSALTDLEVSNWDVSNVTEFGDVFLGLTALESLDLTSWNVSNGTNFLMTFANTGLKSINIDGWDMSNSTMSIMMFANNPNLSSISLSNVKTSASTIMTGMFASDPSLHTLNLSSDGWNTNADSAQSMFVLGSLATSLGIGEDNPTTSLLVVVKDDTEKAKFASSNIPSTTATLTTTDGSSKTYNAMNLVTKDEYAEKIASDKKALESALSSSSVATDYNNALSLTSVADTADESDFGPAAQALDNLVQVLSESNNSILPDDNYSTAEEVASGKYTQVAVTTPTYSYNGTATAEKNSLVTNLPSGYTVSYASGDEPDLSSTGTKTTKITVTNGTMSYTLPITYNVTSLADQYDPQAATGTTVNEGDAVDAKSLVANASDLPSDTQYSVDVDTTTPGDKTATVTVTYSDGSKDTITAPVTVKSQADQYDPQAASVTVNEGDTVDAKSLVANADDLPSGTQFTTDVDTTTPGEKTATVTVTYPDGTTDTVESTVTVKSQADQYDPQAGSATVNEGDTVDAKSLVANADDLPSGTQFSTDVDTSTPGEKTATVTVTYPDGTTDTIESTVTVKSQADQYDPQAATVTVNEGDTVDAKSLVANADQLPSGTQFSTDVDTTTPGEKTATVTVTYPDGTTDTVESTVTVKSQTDQYDPQAATGTTVNENDSVDAKSLISNADQLPADTKYSVDVDTSTPGEKTATVTVTYPDGTTDTVEATVTVKSQADQYTPEAATGTTVNEGDSVDAKSLVANADQLPSGTKFSTDVDTTTPGEKTATVTVTYPDGTTDTVQATVTVKSQADQYDPEAASVTVNEGDTVDAKSLVANADELPADTKYSVDVDTSTPGDKTATVTVTYPDGTTDTVEATVTVKSQADQYTPEAATGTTVNEGDSVDAKSLVANADQLPSGTKFSTDVDTTTPGEKTATVTVTYPDGTTDTVQATVTVKSQADQYDPEAASVTVNEGDTVDAKSLVANADELPADTKYSVDVDTSTPGDKTATVNVTYPDGTTDTVEATVTVKSQADQYDPQAATVTVNEGDTVDAKSLVANADDLPSGTQYSTDVDTSTPGEKTATVTVTYPDGTTDTVNATVTVKSQADQYTPEAATGTTVNENDSVDAKSLISNADQLPADTKYSVDVDASTPGEKTATVTVTYPDGTTDTVDATVTVKSQEDQYTPEAATGTTVNENDSVDAKSLISNADDLPSGTQFTTDVDTSTPGDKTATVTVTYPDGTTDTVETTVTVNSQADQYDPEAANMTVNEGETVDAKSLISNADDLPSGTQFATDVDTSTPGEKNAIVTITYPDGTTDTVYVTVTVKSQADQYDPEAASVTVNEGDTVDAKSLVANADELPTGTEFTTDVDTTTPGEKTATVTVTYPDGTTDTVESTVTVAAPSTDQGNASDSEGGDGSTSTNEDQSTGSTESTGEGSTSTDQGNASDNEGGDGTTSTNEDQSTGNAGSTSEGSSSTDQSSSATSETSTEVKTASETTSVNANSSANAQKLPQTGNKSTPAALALGTLIATFGLALGFKKRRN